SRQASAEHVATSGGELQATAASRRGQVVAPGGTALRYETDARVCGKGSFFRERSGRTCLFPASERPRNRDGGWKLRSVARKPHAQGRGTAYLHHAERLPGARRATLTRGVREQYPHP